MNDLDQVRGELIAIQTDADRLVDGLTEDQFHARPGPGRWSICECLVHLNLVNGMDVELIERAVRTARTKGWTASGPFRYGAISSWFIRRMEPPVKLKFKAPRAYVPPPGQPRERVVAEFRRINDRLVDILGQAGGLDLVRIRVPAPVIPWIKFSFTQRMRLIAAHDRRHLWQAWQNR